MVFRHTPFSLVIFASASLLSSISVHANPCASLFAAPASLNEKSLEITHDFLRNMRDKAQSVSGAEDRLRELVTRTGVDAAALNQDVINQHNRNYTNVLPRVAISNQKNSGRCWIYAGCTMVRSSSAIAGKVSPAFEFSQSYLHFFNMLEKSNKILVKAMTAIQPNMPKEDLKKIIKGLVAKSGVRGELGDGGWFEWFSFLVEKYGLVPKSVMEETASSQNTEGLISDISKQMLLTVDRMQAFLNKSPRKKDASAIMELKRMRLEAMQEIYQILTTHLGVVPETFKFRDANGLEREFSPKLFATDYIRFNAKDFVAVTNFTDQGPGYFRIQGTSIGVTGKETRGSSVEFLNLGIDRMEQLVQQSINQGQTLWFAADVSHDIDHATGIMHPGIFQRSDVLGLPPQHSPDKAFSLQDMLRLGLISANHAMAFTGYDRPDPNQPLIKLLVDNSWGQAAGDGGLYHMYRPWFQRYVQEIIVPVSLLSPVELDLLSKKPKIIRENDL